MEFRISLFPAWTCSNSLANCPESTKFRSLHFKMNHLKLMWPGGSSLDMCLGKLVFSRSTTGDRMSFFLVPFVWTGTDAVQLPQQRLETTSQPQSGSPMRKSHGNSLMSALGARFWRCEVFGEEALAPQRPWNLERACQLGSNTWKWEKKGLGKKNKTRYVHRYYIFNGLLSCSLT